jgi:hypothetical protein
MNWVRHPVQNATQHLGRVGQSIAERVGSTELSRRGLQDPTVSNDPQQNGKSNGSNGKSNSQFNDQSNDRDRSNGNGFSNPTSLASAPYSGGTLTPERVQDDPILGQGQKLTGRRGRYLIERLLGQRDRERWYEGIWQTNTTSVVVKEYWLDCTATETRRQIKPQLDRLVSVSLRSGGVQDFRLIVPWDAFISQDEKRGYLITKTLENSVSLRTHLTQTSSVPAAQVRQILAQVLQTLWFLHNQSIRFADGETHRGLAHGNLSLDSLLIQSDPDPIDSSEPQFRIYAAQLALWESLFQPLTTARPDLLTQMAQEADLAAVGKVGVLLLMGDSSEVDRVTLPGFQPETYPEWTAIVDENLKQFLRQLLRLETPYFASAEEACRILRELPFTTAVPEPEATIAPGKTRKSLSLLWALLGFTGLLLLTASLGVWLSRRSGDPTGTRARLPAPDSGSCCLSEVSVPPGIFPYAVDQLWGEELLTASGKVAFNTSLQKELERRNSRLRQFRLQSGPTDVIQQVQSGAVSFALSRQLDSLPPGLKQEPVASDGIALLVAFSNARRQQSVPTAFQGAISLNELRQLLTGERQSFDRLGNRPITLYQPQNPELVELLQQQVFAQDTKVNPARLETLKPVRSSLFGQILEDFEDRQSISLSFELLSKTFGQCSVYPLAIENRTGQKVQMLVQDNGMPIVPEVDLCKTKGGYFPNPDAFAPDRYPLPIHLVVIYRVDRSAPGEAFANALRTQEGQCLLQEAGLAPLKVNPCGQARASSNVVQSWILGN